MAKPADLERSIHDEGDDNKTATLHGRLTEGIPWQNNLALVVLPRMRNLCQTEAA